MPKHTRTHTHPHTYNIYRNAREIHWEKHPVFTRIQHNITAAFSSMLYVLCVKTVHGGCTYYLEWNNT